MALRRCADVLLCFTLDFSANRAAQIAKVRYRIAAGYYSAFRRALAEETLASTRIRLLTEPETSCMGIHDSAYCQRCRKARPCPGRLAGDAPVFGIREKTDGSISVEPLVDTVRTASAASRRFGGFVCKGTFHRFTDAPRKKDGLESFWSWAGERLRKHHGIRPENVGLYLKELEWKYNHRALDVERQALHIAALLPAEAIRLRSAD